MAIYTMRSEEVEYLKEFAEDWVKDLGLNYQVGPQLRHHRDNVIQVKETLVYDHCISRIYAVCKHPRRTIMRSPSPYLPGQSSFRNLLFVISPRVIGTKKGHKYRHPSGPLSTLPFKTLEEIETVELTSDWKMCQWTASID